MSRSAVWGIVALAVLTGCGQADSAGLGPAGGGGSTKLGSCGSETAVFTVMPVDPADLYGWVPLGQMGPPAHTFPTDHQYLYVNNPTTPSVSPSVPVKSPGAIHVVRVKRTQYHELDRSDYAIDFQVCKELLGYFAHLQTLDGSFAAKLGSFDQGCNSYSPNPGLNVTQCYTRNIDVAIGAGDPIGTSGGIPGVFGLDFGLYDRRIGPHAFANPARWASSGDGFDRYHVVASSDYFAEPARSAVGQKVGSFDGSVHRTTAPLGGTIASDIAGSAQGAWFNDGLPTSPEGPHLALAPDNVTPGLQVFSIGLSQPGVASGTWRFTPQGSGLVNRSFAEVTPGPTIYCYEGVMGGVAFLRLGSATTLTLEVRNGPATCGAAEPWGFSGASFTYRR